MSLSAEQTDAILNGVKGCDTFFYVAGGAVLVVLAGMWGFGKVAELLGLSGSSPACDDWNNSDWSEMAYRDGDDSIFNSPDAPLVTPKKERYEKWGIDAMED